MNAYALVQGSSECKTYVSLGDKHFHSNNLDSALYFYSEVLNIGSGICDQNDLILSAILLGEIKRMKQEYDSAFHFLGFSKSMLDQQQIPNAFLMAEYYHKYGSVLLAKGNYSAAKDSFTKSVAFRQSFSGEFDSNLFLTYNNLGISAYYLGDLETASKHYMNALRIIEKHDLSENRFTAIFYQNLAILNATLGIYDQSSYFFLKALTILERILPSDDPNLGRFYINYGRLLQLSGHLITAMDYYDKAEEIFMLNYGPDYSSIGTIMMNRAVIYVTYSDYERALLFNYRALRIFEQSLHPTHSLILATYLNIGYCYEKKEEYGKAIEYYEKSIPPDRVTPENIKTFRNMANLYGLIGDDALAASYFRRSIDNSISFFGEQHPETALSYYAYARYLTRIGNYQASINYLSKAKDIFYQKLGPSDRDYSNILVRLANNYVEQGVNFAKALELLQEAVIALASDFYDKNYLANPNQGQLVADHFLLNALYMKAKALHLYSKEKEDVSLLLKSLETYDLSSVLINMIRNTYVSDESRLLITDITSDILTGALDCSLDLYHLTLDPFYLEKAFEYAEKGKAAVLLSAINDLEAKNLAFIPESIQMFERDLRFSLDSYNQQLHEERLKSDPDQAKINLWQSVIFELNQRYDSLIYVINEQYPEYYDIRYGMSIITVNELQAFLSENQLLIEYVLGDDVLYIFAITSDTIFGSSYSLPDSFAYDLEKLRMHLTGLNIHDYKLSEYHEFVSLSRNLYNLLILPVQELMDNRSLIIIPDNQLGYLPFEVLLTEDAISEVIDFRNLPYLIKEHPISYAYSSTLLQKKEKSRRRGSNGKILAFAPEYDPNPNGDGKTLRSSNFLSIPWAADEVKNITNKFRGTALIGSEATESKFIDKASRYSVLHLAMHTQIDNDNPMFSKLIFSAHTDSSDYSVLNAYELFNLQLSADLAVLSACKTGDGRLQRGEGIMSIARGFFYAGVPSIIMTLWDVDDHSSSNLITLFYDKLAKGLHKDEALRVAKLDYLNAADRLKAHPHYWAGFVNIGQTEPFKLKKPQPLWLIAVPAIILLMLAVFLQRRKRLSRNDLSR